MSELAKKSCDLLHLFCDMKEVDEDTYYRFSNVKAMDWLKFKVDAVTAALDRKSVCTSTRSVGLDQLKFLGQADSSTSDKLRYACSLIEDYLPPDVTAQLRSHMKLPEMAVKKIHDVGESTSASGDKALPKEDYFVDPNYGMKVEEQKLTRAQKQLAKVDKKNIQPITAFFNSKPK